MILRQAEITDLPQLQAVYQKIIGRMNESKIQIWDDIYPCSSFQEDITQRRLYVLVDGGEIAGAFALCETNKGAQAITWSTERGKARYLDRLGVNVDYLRRGIGSRLLKEAIALSGEQGAAYLRLFVVDCNEPAIRLYEKNGFHRASGIFMEEIDSDLVFREYGFEISTGGLNQ